MSYWITITAITCVCNQPLVSDADYDALLRRLKELEAERPDLVTPASATQRVSGQVVEIGRRGSVLVCSNVQYLYYRLLNEGARMPKKPANHGQPWTPPQVKELKRLAKENTPTRVIGMKLGRTPKAVLQKAHEQDVSLKPTNQLPFKRLGK